MSFFKKITNVFHAQKENDNNSDNCEINTQKDILNQENLLKRIPFHGRTPMAPDFIPLNLAEAEMLAEQQIKIIRDCENLVAETTNPDVFIKRYFLLLDSLEWLSELEKVIEFEGELPHIYFEKAEDAFQYQIQLFINRCFEKYKKQITELKQSTAKYTRVGRFYADVSEIEEYFDEQSQKYFESKDKELSDIVNFEIEKQKESTQQQSEEDKVQKTKLNRNPKIKWFFDEIEKITYTIPNFVEKSFIEKWDKAFSLEVFLRNQNIPNNIVYDIIHSDNCYNKCIEHFEKQYQENMIAPTYYYAVYSMIQKLKNEIITMTICEKEPIKIIQKYFLLLFYNICNSLDFIVSDKEITDSTIYFLNCYINNLKNTYNKTFKLNNEESCFMFACQNSNKTVQEIFELGYCYIKDYNNNYTNIIKEILNFDCIQNIIGKSLEQQFNYGKVNIKSLLLNPNITKKPDNNIVFRYDIPNMKNEKGYYILTEEGKKVAENDIILSLHNILENQNCQSLQMEINSNNICFEPAENEDISDVCRITYNPYTKTGKEAKYPYCLHFKMINIISNKGKSSKIFGKIDYLANNQIGKIDITFSNDNWYIKINKNNKGQIQYKETEIILP